VSITSSSNIDLAPGHLVVEMLAKDLALISNRSIGRVNR